MLTISGKFGKLIVKQAHQNLSLRLNIYMIS